MSGDITLGKILELKMLVEFQSISDIRHDIHRQNFATPSFLIFVCEDFRDAFCVTGGGGAFGRPWISVRML